VEEEDVDENDEECDYVGLETRAAVGEQEEKIEDQARQPLAADDDSEVEERAFKERVAAVTRMQPRATRLYLISRRDRFAPAIGGGIGINMQLHLQALRCHHGTTFGLKELTSENADGRRFVAALNFEAITRRYDLLERTPGALLPTWQLCSQLPDSDLETGAPMDASKFASLWQRKAADVLTALIKKHEGELLPPLLWFLHHLARAAQQAQIRAEHREIRAFYGGRDPELDPAFITTSEDSNSS
jgi:hypothetical protein